MRMRMVVCGALVAALGLMGCAADVGEREASLQRVDESAMTSQLLYSVPGLEAPLTLVELEALGIDRTEAIPVRVEIFDAVAVAWYAPAGESLIGRENIVSLWRVVDRQPIADELAVEETPTVGEETPSLAPDVRLTDTVIEAQPTADTTYIDPVGETIIDFVDQLGGSDEAWLLVELGVGHPGCI